LKRGKVEDNQGEGEERIKKERKRRVELGSRKGEKNYSRERRGNERT
jgi:hypothetical protein